MDPILLAGLVFGGVAVVLLAVHWKGGSAPRSLPSDEAELQRVWSVDDATPIREMQRSADDTSALLALDDGRYATIFMLGEHLVCRRLDGTRVAEHADYLVISLGDFGAPSVRVHLPDQATRSDWHRRLEG